MKRRVGELEGRIGELESDLGTSKSESTKLQADNISLFEKIKYLQSYYAKQVG